jgi:hypothetical protein
VSIGFYLLGQFKSAELEPNDWLRQLEKWILNECSELVAITRLGFIDEKPCLFSSFHPAAEEVEIVVPDPDHITVSANTSTVGPGYHIFLCSLIHRWTDNFSIDWRRFGADDDTTFGDETDYFFTNDKQNVYDHMERWLKSLTGSFFDGTLDPDSKEIALCMPMNVRFEGDALAITQLGPRDRDWLRRMSEGTIYYGEFFPWYEVGFNAEYYLGRALVQMWSDVRWRKAANDQEKRLIESVLNSLEIAYRMNPSLDFPWNEWNELLTLSDRVVPHSVFVEERASGPGRIGYRRTRVKTCLPGNWWIETEGSFSAFESDSDSALSSFDPPREIWFTAYSFSAEDPNEAFRRMRDKALNEKHGLVHENGNYIAVADITQKTTLSGKYYLLRSSNMGILCRSVCTLVFEELSDREWAIRVWRSLKPPVKIEGPRTAF